MFKVGDSVKLKKSNKHDKSFNKLENNEIGVIISDKNTFDYYKIINISKSYLSCYYKTEDIELYPLKEEIKKLEKIIIKQL